MANSAGLVTVSFPSWTDTQSNAMKVTLAKGRASTAKSKADAVASAERQADIDQKIQDIAGGKPLTKLRPTRDEPPRELR